MKPEVSVLIATRNEEGNLPRCLEALKDFDDVIVIDSCSTDGTARIANEYNVPAINFQWNGFYPKKRQWCLENIKTKYDYIFFVDADEVLTPDLIIEISNLSFDCAGYFVKGRYVWQGKILKHGLVNNKLALFHKDKFEFPVVDDLEIEGMGEIEGHYQPVLKGSYAGEKIGQIETPLLHYAEPQWLARHQKYALWEAEMIRRDLYPPDPKPFRNSVKRIFRKLPMRGLFAFMHSYILKLGFLDGKAGYHFALSRYGYYKMVSAALTTSNRKEKNGGIDTAAFVREK